MHEYDSKMSFTTRENADYFTQRIADITIELEEHSIMNRDHQELVEIDSAELINEIIRKEALCVEVITMAGVLIEQSLSHNKELEALKATVSEFEYCSQKNQCLQKELEIRDKKLMEQIEDLTVLENENQRLSKLRRNYENKVTDLTREVESLGAELCTKKHNLDSEYQSSERLKKEMEQIVLELKDKERNVQQAEAKIFLIEREKARLECQLEACQVQGKRVSVSAEQALDFQLLLLRSKDSAVQGIELEEIHKKLSQELDDTKQKAKRYEKDLEEQSTLLSRTMSIQKTGFQEQFSPFGTAIKNINFQRNSRSKSLHSDENIEEEINEQEFVSRLSSQFYTKTFPENDGPPIKENNLLASILNVVEPENTEPERILPEAKSIDEIQEKKILTPKKQLFVKEKEVYYYTDEKDLFLKRHENFQEAETQTEKIKQKITLDQQIQTYIARQERCTQVERLDFQKNSETQTALTQPIQRGMQTVFPYLSFSNAQSESLGKCKDIDECVLIETLEANITNTHKLKNYSVFYSIVDEKVQELRGMKAGPSREEDKELIGDTNLFGKSPKEIFFQYSILAAKANFADFDKVCRLDNIKLYEQALHERIPLFQWPKWLAVVTSRIYLNTISQVQNNVQLTRRIFYIKYFPKFLSNVITEKEIENIYVQTT